MELDWEREEPRDNVIAGTVGAFLGSLIGVACIVLVNQLGYVSAICGAVMTVCSIKGYTMLGGVPVLISAFRDPSGRAAAREPEAVPAQEKAQTTLQAEFYSLQKNWMRPLRLDALMHEAFGDAWPKQNPDADAQQQALTAAGRVYAEGVDDELYREDLDIACRLAVYEEDGQTRYAVLYADSKWDGYYLFREITGLPELVDEDYPAALAELEDIIGLTIPTLEDFR